MLSPRTVPLMIRHFDAIDKTVASRLNRNRPWLEPALTSLLCDLFDQDTQRDVNLAYTVEQLNSDLAEPEGVLAISFRIDTHEYGPDLERWVTQADIGFVINYNDFLLPEQSWTTSWLLQAKRLAPDRRDPLTYSETSRFTSVDHNQKSRVEQLRRAVGVDFIRYLLYCPRPGNLDALTKAKLEHLRTSAVSTNIFDYTLGLALRDDLLNGGASLAAGVFVSDVDRLPRTLGEVHRAVLSSTMPLSWFVVQHFEPQDRALVGRRRRPREHHPADPRSDEAERELQEWALGIVRGEREAIDRLLSVLDIPVDQPFTILPQHTITVNVTAGERFDPERRAIRTDL